MSRSTRCSPRSCASRSTTCCGIVTSGPVPSRYARRATSSCCGCSTTASGVTPPPGGPVAAWRTWPPGWRTSLGGGLGARAATGRPGGGLENLAARLENIGGRLTVTTHEDQFDLLAEAPATLTDAPATLPTAPPRPPP